MAVDCRQIATGTAQGAAGNRDGANPSERRERHGGRLWRVWREPVAVRTCHRRHGEPVPVRTRDRHRTCHPPEPVALLPSADRTRGGCACCPLPCRKIATANPPEPVGRSERPEPVTVGAVSEPVTVAPSADRTRGGFQNLTETLRKAAHGQDNGAAVVSTPKTADILGVIPNKYFRSNPCIYWRLCVFTKNFVGVAPTRGYTVGVFGKIADMKQTLIKNGQRRTATLFGGTVRTRAAAGGMVKKQISPFAKW